MPLRHTSDNQPQVPSRILPYRGISLHGFLGLAGSLRGIFPCMKSQMTAETFSTLPPCAGGRSGGTGVGSPDETTPQTDEPHEPHDSAGRIPAYWAVLLGMGHQHEFELDA
jgi:hypothetical protein